MASDIKRVASRRERSVQIEQDEVEQEIDVVYAYTQQEEVNSDPFCMTPDEFSKLSGLSTNFKRRKINKAEQVRSKSAEIGSFFAYDNFNLVTPDYNLVYLAKIYEMNSPHFAAVNAKVTNIVDLGYDLEPSYKQKRALEDTTNPKSLQRANRKAEDEKQMLLDWLDTLNWMHPFSDTLHNLWLDFEATGNCYLEIGRTKSGKINYVGHIPATTMRVRVHRDGFVQLIGHHVVFFRNFGDSTTDNPLTDDPNPNEVIHIANYTPMNSYYGIPDIIPAKEALAGDEFASRFNLDYFEHKAVPRYIITLQGAKLSSNSQRAIVELFETGVKGKNHRSVFIPLPPSTSDAKVEFKMTPIEAGTQDSSFNNYRKMNIDEIFMAHRTPKIKAGYFDNIGLAAAQAADKGFKEGVTRPKQTMLEKRIDLILGTMTDNWKFHLNELTLTDAETQSKIDERLLRMQAVVPNEVRKPMGLPPVEGGDTVVQLNAQAAADQTAQGNQSRTRDQQRQSGQTDSAGNGRNAQGSGRTAP